LSTNQIFGAKIILIQALTSSTPGSNNDANSKTTTEEQSCKDEGLLDELLVTTKPDAVVSTETAGETEPDEAGGPEQTDEVVTKISINSVAHEEEEMETVTVISGQVSRCI
jgi:hypothetical protein